MTDSDRSLTIATPCFNEAASLPDYFAAIEEVRAALAADGWATRLLLIDDGSGDDTGAIIDRYAEAHADTRALHHPRNLGYGGAIKTALALARTPWLAFVDADSNYDQRLIRELVKHAGPEADVVNVSILAPGGSVGYPWYRLLLSSLASRVYRALFPLRTRGVYTMTCGFRLYRTAVIPSLFPIADDFYATAEILLRGLSAGVRVRDLPATNAKRLHGVSKLRVLRVSLGHLRLALRARLGLIPPAPPPAQHLQRIAVADAERFWSSGRERIGAAS